MKYHSGTIYSRDLDVLLVHLCVETTNYVLTLLLAAMCELSLQTLSFKFCTFPTTIC